MVMWSINAVWASNLMDLCVLAAASRPMTPEQQEAYRMGQQMGIVIGALLGGAIVGLMPLIAGLCRGRRTLAFASWGACILANFLLGILVSVPLAVTLMVVVLCLEKQGEKNLICTAQVEPTRNLYEGVPIGAPPVEQPDYAGSPLRPR